MRCSFSEDALVLLIEGQLPPVRRARTIEHVDGCERCRELLEELRVVDALLLGPRQIEPAPNFTFRTMAELRGVHPPHVRRTPALLVIAAYLLFAWTIIGAWLLLGGAAAREALASSGASALRFSGLASAGDAATRLFGHATAGVSIAMAIIVGVDIVAGILLVAAYTARRPHLARRLSRITETIG